MKKVRVLIVLGLLSFSIHGIRKPWEKQGAARKSREKKAAQERLAVRAEDLSIKDLRELRAARKAWFMGRPNRRSYPFMYGHLTPEAIEEAIQKKECKGQPLHSVMSSQRDSSEHSETTLVNGSEELSGSGDS